MKKKWNLKSIFLGGLFSAFVPVGAYLYLKSKGHDGHIKLPLVYGIERIDSNKSDGNLILDTIYHEVSNNTFINQLGDTVRTNETYKGKILVVNFFFSTCPNICPTLTRNMQLLNKAYKKNDTSIQFLSITVDPKTDTVKQLRMYADKYKANHDKWHFLTGNKKNIYDFARNELYLSLNEGSGDENDFIHPEQFVLIDKYRNIRGYYNGLDSMRIKDCADDIAYLMVEKNRLHEKKSK